MTQAIDLSSPTSSPSASLSPKQVPNKYAKMLRTPSEDDIKLSQMVTDQNFFRCMLVQDIPDSFTDIALCKLFEDFGEIEKLWIHGKNSKNRHGRATIIFKNAEDAEMAEAIMNETEVEDRTLQVHIGVPPSERYKASEKREKQRQERKLKKQKENELYFNSLNNMDPFEPFGYGRGMGGFRGRGGFGFFPRRGRGRGRGRGFF